MKKIIGIALAFIFVFALTTTAFAASKQTKLRRPKPRYVGTNSIRSVLSIEGETATCYYKLEPQVGYNARLKIKNLGNKYVSGSEAYINLATNNPL